MIAKGGAVTGLGLTMIGGTFSVDILIEVGIGIFIAFMLYKAAKIVLLGKPNK